jgi:glutamate-1-semialdehyde 2,1-aminomutase
MINQEDKYRRSREFLARARNSLVGGVSSPFRAKLPVPLYFEDAFGSRARDADGNEFIDYALAWGPLILGHKHPALMAALSRQASRPMNYGAQHELEFIVAEKIQSLVPCAERILFTSSGSEAVHIAIRLARAVTGRRRLLRFEGHYHGWFDPILWSYRATLDQLGPEAEPIPAAGSQGQFNEESGHLLVAPWNNLEAVEKLFEWHASEIAAIITEPILCNSGGILPAPGFLEGLREITRKHGALLIFDEVITGFRVHLGGAQSLFGVTPDIATFGKAIAGGVTLSVTAGKAEFMERVGNGVSFGGTFNGNPVSLAVANAALDELSRDNGAALECARTTGERLMAGIREAASEVGLPVIVSGVGSCFWVHFTDQAELRNYRQLLKRRQDRLDQYLPAMLDEGVLLLPEGRVYVSAVHDERDVTDTLAAVRKVFTLFT